MDIERLKNTDPEYYDILERFISNDVGSLESLPTRDKDLATVAALVATDAKELFCLELQKSILSPVEVKEILYQSTAYLGLGRAIEFVLLANDVYQKQGVSLPLERQGTVNAGNRREKGSECQCAIFGEGMRNFWCTGEREKVHINRWLAANCFGDYYTRDGLSLKDRELVTFCLLASLGSVEPQLKSHIKANDNLGNDRLYLISVLSHILLYIGYPKSLNALNAIDEILNY